MKKMKNHTTFKRVIPYQITIVSKILSYPFYY